MVVALGPGKFYGSSLPRPRYYTDVKLNDERVDPPVPVLDSFLSWAHEAHWSMGGVSFKRQRLQGRIEGSVKKLRAEREKFFKNQSDTSQIRHKHSEKDLAPPGTVRSATPSPPPAPVAVKRRRLVGLVDEDEDERESEERGNENGGGGRRRPARKLWDDFDRAAKSPVKSSGSGSEGVASRTRGRRSEKEEDLSDERVEVAKEVGDLNAKGKKGKKSKNFGKSDKRTGASTPPSVTRSSPRLVKRRLN